MIIALAGAARSGKDTVADMMTQFFGDKVVKRVQIAGPLKAFCRDVFGWTETHTDGALKDDPDLRYPRPCKLCETRGTVSNFPSYEEYKCSACMGVGKTYLTPRQAMQALGDDWSTPLYEPIWAVKAARTASLIDSKGGVAIITDCRFLRDIAAASVAGGVIIQVHRTGAGLTGAAAQHRSEVERESPEFQVLVDHHIYNDGTLEELRDKVRQIGDRLRADPNLPGVSQVRDL